MTSVTRMRGSPIDLFYFGIGAVQGLWGSGRMEVNEIRDDVRLLLDECKKNQVQRLMLRRAAAELLTKVDSSRSLCE